MVEPRVLMFITYLALSPLLTQWIQPANAPAITGLTGRSTVQIQHREPLATADYASSSLLRWMAWHGGEKEEFQLSKKYLKVVGTRTKV